MTFSSYLALDRRWSLALGRALPPTAHGAVLFADIVGFSALSARLSATLGARGAADALTVVLNGVYGALTDEVHRLGGSVVDFSGDAITCWFDDEPVVCAPPPPRWPDGSHRAVECALGLVRTVAALSPVRADGDVAVSLAIKAAVATGEAGRWELGDAEQRRVDFLGGPPLERVAAAERLAGPGEVVIDDATAGRLPPSRLRELAGDAAPGPFRIVERLAAPPLATLGWLPPAAPYGSTDDAVAQWVTWQLRGRADQPTELRPAAALFVHLGARAEDGAELDRFVRFVQGVIRPLDGTLVQVSAGDKGGYLYVAFGAPVAREDLAACAAEAALAIAAGAPGDGAALRFGADLGVARTGAYGGPNCRTYGVIGDAVNRAARLMSCAEAGTILVSEGFAAAAGPAFELGEPVPVVLKGGAAPIAVRPLLRQVPHLAGSRRYRRPMVGRGAELEALVARLPGPGAGRGSVTVVRGEAGVGKSRLVEDARRRLLAGHRVTWLDGVARAGGGPLAPLLPLLEDHFYVGLASTPEDRRALFETVLDELCAELPADTAEPLRAEASFVAALVGVRWAGSVYEQHDPRHRLSRSLAAVARLLAAEAQRRPLVLHLEDGHWLDAETRELLALLAPWTHQVPLAVVVDERPADPSADPTARDAATPPAAPPGGPVQVIELGAIDAEGVRSLAAALTGGHVGPRLVQALARRSGGNPLYVEQLLLDQLERGDLAVDEDGHWELRAGPSAELPLELAAVLGARLDRLAHATRTIVQLGAVLGERFDTEALVALAVEAGEASPEEALAAHDDARRAGIWDADDDPAEGRAGGAVSFRHGLLRDAAYARQPLERRRALHRCAAVTLARHDGVAAERVAEHLLAGADDRAALPWLAQAAHTATSRSAHRDAARLQELALGALERLDEPWPGADALRLATAHTSFTLGDAERAVGLLAAVDLAAVDLAAVTAVERLAALRLLGDANERLGRHEEATVAYEAALALVAEDPDPQQAGELYAGLALVHLRQGDAPAAADLAELALHFAPAGPDGAALRARAEHHRAVIALDRGLRAEAATATAACLSAAAEADAPLWAAAAHNLAGLLAEADGAPHDAAAAFRAAVAGFEDVGNEHGLACALDNLGGALRRHGDVAAAQGCVERAVEILARIGWTGEAPTHAMWAAGAW